MALFKMKWLRRFVRKNTKEIPLDQAERWKQRLSIGYAILAWNAFGIVAYMIYSGKSDWGKYHGLRTEEERFLTPGQQFARQLKLNNAKVYRFSGFGLQEIGEPEKPTESSEATTTS